MSAAAAPSTGPDPGLAAYARDLAEQLERAHTAERATRLALLRLHGVMGLVVGAMVLCTGTAATFEELIGLWTRPALGLTALVGGTVLLAGVGLRRRRYRLEAIGLVLMGAWDAAMTAAIAVSLAAYPGAPTGPGGRLSGGGVVMFPPWHLTRVDPQEPRPYAVAVYSSLALMLWTVHLRAVLRDRRTQNPHTGAGGRG